MKKFLFYVLLGLIIFYIAPAVLATAADMFMQSVGDIECTFVSAEEEL